MKVETDGKRLKEWLDGIMQTVKRDGDEVIAVTGRERSGKSTAAFHIANYLDPDFDVEKQIAFNADAYTNRAVQLQKYRPIMLDEATEGGFSRTANSDSNIRLAKFLTVAGERNLIHFICWPKLRWLDPILKEHRCRYNVHVVRRFKDHAIAAVRLLQDGDLVLDPPRVLFYFDYREAVGEKWDAYKALKAAYVRDVGQGEDELATQREAQLVRIRREIRPIVAELLAGTAA